MGSFGSKKKGEEEEAGNRCGEIGFDSAVNVHHGFLGNGVCTSRYKVYDFVPKNLKEQFRRTANFYFLLMSIIMLIGTYFPKLFQSPISPFGTLLTLVIVLGVTMVKDGVEDFNRHKADRKENGSLVRVIRNGEQCVIEKESVCVGDYVLVQNKEQFPADLILFASADANGQCFVETSNIDGETNLKIRKVPQRMVDLNLNSVENLPKNGAFECDAPNKDVHNFNAVVEIDGVKVPCGATNFLLRGSVLRNTTWIAGLVVYTGEESKLMMNRGESAAKLSSIERTVNRLIVVVFLTQFGLVLLSVIINAIYTAKYSYWYLDNNSSQYILPFWLGNFFTFYILYSNFVPISLYVTIEMVNLIQGFFITHDQDMYYADDNVSATCKNSSLCQELGQVEYIFSDKTGTLTCNMMEFKNASINNMIHDLESATRGVDMHDANIVDFFRVLSICHTIVPDEEGEPVELAGVKCPAYEAESPDEAALVEAAARVGIRFWSRTSDSATVKEFDSLEDREYKVLAVNEFNSTRKRMSVLVRETDGRYMLYCKGADNVMFDRTLRLPSDEAINEHLTEFAQEGLRTLVIAKREIQPQNALAWLEKFKNASLSITERKSLLAQVAEEIEHHMTIVGATAIEDRLQDEVPETLENLQKAGIKIWVLTGDKLETAVNIGYSAKLLNKTMRVMTISTDNKEEAAEELLRLQNVITISEDYNLIRKFKATLRKVQNAITRPLRGRKSSEVTENGTPLYSTDDKTLDMGGVEDDEAANASKILQDIVAEANREKRSASAPVRASTRITRSVSDQLDDTANDPGIAMVDLSAVTVSDVERGDDLYNIQSTTSLYGAGDTIIPDDFTDIGNVHDADIATTDHLALVIDGKTLGFVMSDERLKSALLHVGRVCKAVIACRVSPAQKAEIVTMVKDGIKSNPVTLAIGDGANDVTMIQAAHLGIGISGREGRQAVNCADFAIAQFRFLKKLLLVHGRWNYRRMSKVVLISFYKNILLVFGIFIFSFFAQMSGTSPFDSLVYSGFNFFTGMPPILIGAFDKDMTKEFLLQFPIMYVSGREAMYLNHWKIAQWILRAGVHALICSYLSVYVGMTFGIEPQVASLYAFGLIVFAAIFFTVLNIVGLETVTWNGMHAFFYPGSVLLFFVVCLILSSMGKFYISFSGVAQEAFGAAVFWALAVFFIPVTNFGIELTCKYIRLQLEPNIIDLGCEVNHGKSTISPKEFGQLLDVVYYQKKVNKRDLEDVIRSTYSSTASEKQNPTRVARRASSAILYPTNV